MAFELFFRAGGDNQIGYLRSQETPQLSHPLDFAYLVGDTLFELLVQFDDFLSSFAEFAEQPCVLNGDDSLGGEVRDEGNLLFGEGTHCLAVHDECTHQFVLLQHWNSRKRPYTPKFDGGYDIWVALFNVGPFFRQIGDVNYRFCGNHATDGIYGIRTK